MVWENFNWIDYIFLGIFLVSGLFGIMRGFIREIVSIITWVAAFLIASAFAAPLAAMFSGATASAQTHLASMASGTGINASSAISAIAMGTSFIVIFIGVMIIGSIINHILAGVAAVPGVGLINRLLGGCFGLARGFLANLLIIFMVQLTPFAQQVVWAQSQMVQAYQPSVVWLGNSVQQGWGSFSTKFQQVFQDIKQNTFTSR